MPGAHVLVVHESSAILDLVTAALAAEGHTSETASNAPSAFEVIDHRRPDAVLLSLDIAVGDAIDLCRRVRLRARAPVIAMSVGSDEARKVNALDAGADDYLTEPFSVPELLARLRVALRHRRELATTLDESVIHVGALRLDPDGHAAAVGSRILPLTPKEFQLLVLLARNAGRVVAHRTLLESIWPQSRSYDTLRLHVSQLRKKLARTGESPALVTEPGIGYRLETGTDG
jgi:two-component system KDP operon response regulator KdpE